MNRTFLMVIAAALALGGCGATMSSQPLADSAVQSHMLPRTESDLRHLNDVHVDIVRRAQRQCEAEGYTVPAGGEFELPCLTLAVDRAVEASDDEGLRAYHDALSRRERYDPRRTDDAWRQFILTDDAS